MGLPVVCGIEVGDSASSWEAAGFSVVDSEVRIGSVSIRLTGDQGDRGITAWHLTGLEGADPAPGNLREIDGLATVSMTSQEPVGDRSQPTRPEHVNGVSGIDHIVIGSPDWRRTVEALTAIGLAPRRQRTFERNGVAHRQVFFRAGDVIVELSADEEPTGDGPATFWGLAFAVDDIDATAAQLGDAVTTPIDAVQPGRRICALRDDAFDVSVPTAFMTPHVRGASHRSEPWQDQ